MKRTNQTQAEQSPRLPSSLPVLKVTSAEAGTPLDRWLTTQPAFGSRSKVRDAIERGRIFLNRQEVTLPQSQRPLHAGDVIHLWLDRPGSAKRRPAAASGSSKLQIIFEDDDLLVINKPAGLLVQPLADESDPSLVELAQEYLRSRGKRRPLIVHRIDRDTSGLVLLAKNHKAHEHLKEQFERQTPERLYWAIVNGVVEPKAGTWRNYLRWDQQYLIQREARPGEPHRKLAVAHYRVLEQFSSTALLEVHLETGKRNQIRLQASLRGYPVVGEKLYDREKKPGTMSFPRQALHAKRLVILHPQTGKRLAFEAPLPEDMARLLTKLKRRERSGAG